MRKKSDRFQQSRVSTAHLLEQARRRFARHQRDDDYFSTSAFHDVPFFRVQSFQSIIPALGVNIRLGHLEETAGAPFGKNANPIHARERGQDCSAVGFGIEWTIGTFELMHTFIAIHSHEQGIAGTLRRFQVSDMPQMQQVKASVGND